MLDKINGKLSIGARLGILSGLFVASSAVVTSLLVRNSLNDIAFSEKESAGTEYLEDVWDALQNGGGIDARTAENEFSAGAAANAFLNASNEAQRIDAGLALIARVADQSNLTLDPDLDSFYAMDAVTVKLPALLTAAIELENAVAAPADAEHALKVTVAAGRVQDAANAATSSLTSSIENNGDGQTAAALQSTIDEIQRAAGELVAAAQAAAPGQTLDGSLASYIDATDTTWRATASELSRLLDVRVAGKQSELIFQLLLVALFLAVAGAMAILMSSGMTRRFKSLSGVMDRLREGDFSVEVPHTDDSHETGKIASTLKVLRDDLSARTDADAKRLAETQLGAEGMLNAISKSQAMIEFEPDGTILTANENFCKAVGYSLDEIKGQHHSMFVDPADRQSTDYRAFWTALGRGEFQAGKFRRVGKGGNEIWIRASYNPIPDADGNVAKVVKFASDITESELKALDSAGLLKAISKSQATIEFKPDGTILKANENFCNAVGYSLEEIRGQHHSMFVDPDDRKSAEYGAFWAALGRGEFQAGKFRRIGNGGKEIWIRASYNPIPDADGNIVKVVKFASDITESEQTALDAGGKLTAISKSQAVIEFKPDGTILTANENFCGAVGYALDEIVGKHHSMFIEAEERQSPEYRAFWEALGRGEFRAGKFHRVGNDGKEIWIQASYNPILDGKGRVVKVVKFASDITEQENFAADAAGKLAAIGKSQAAIEFKTDGTILTANENFCGAVGYELEEIQGKHHSMFVDAAERQSADYRSFWQALADGQFQSGKFRRVGKGGAEIWIQASYNPILDAKGRVTKVVKFASDITQIENDRKEAEAERLARAQELSEVVAALAGGLKQLAQGDLTSDIAHVFAADYEQLRLDFNDAVGQLREVMTSIVTTAGGIKGGASEISHAADDLSRRTEQQAASLEETAAALDEITATVTKTASGAKQAATVVTSTKADAESSGEVVREAVSAMSSIENSSKEISQIIGVIDEIAFQTNLLALNAGVEAARAGEAGRGFAVVASEVRALAQRSSEAAKEIKGLISASTQHVESGVDRVGKAGEALAEIVKKVTEVNDLVGEIAASAQEQSTALAQVNTAINQMDQSTQQNAAMVEESTAASHSLTQDASGLMDMMSKFNVGDSSASSAPAAAPRGSQSVRQQQKRAANFASSGSAALKMDDSDWEEF